MYYPYTDAQYCTQSEHRSDPSIDVHYARLILPKAERSKTRIYCAFISVVRASKKLALVTPEPHDI